jgi:hypothetical protein
MARPIYFTIDGMSKSRRERMDEKRCSYITVAEFRQSARSSRAISCNNYQSEAFEASRKRLPCLIEKSGEVGEGGG